MAEQTPKGVGTDDTTEYAPSKAPETRREAEERETTADSRLMPGGRNRAAAETGMSAMDAEDVPLLKDEGER